MNKKLTLFLIAWLCIWKLDAQTLYPEVYSSFGGFAQNNSGMITFTAGEPLFETVSSGNNILTQGFNQTMMVTYAATGVLLIPDLKLTAYPNPTVDMVNVMVDNPSAYSLSLSVSDIKGNLLYRETHISTNTQIDLRTFATGVYILAVTYNNQVIKTFKIQKIN